MATTTLERPTTGDQAARLVVDPEELEAWFRERELWTPESRAAFLGCDPATIWRLLNGRRGPGAAIIARVLTAGTPTDQGALFARLFRAETATE